jgi:hypothetical protein
MRRAQWNGKWPFHSNTEEDTTYLPISLVIFYRFHAQFKHEKLLLPMGESTLTKEYDSDFHEGDFVSKLVTDRLTWVWIAVKPK